MIRSRDHEKAQVIGNDRAADNDAERLVQADLVLQRVARENVREKDRRNSTHAQRDPAYTGSERRETRRRAR